LKVPDKYLLQELSILNRLRVTPHSNIIIYFGAHDEVSTNGGLHAMYIVLQYCQGGDLLQLIIDHSKFLSWKFRIQLACQAMSAIVHIHKQNILHRDIKSSVRYLFE
jgi:serine/threonine protein kinase